MLPIWLPHNPKFQHLHPGAPSTPSRDKKLDQVWYPFEAVFHAAAVARYARTIPMVTFRHLTQGKLERCLAHETGFESYLRLSGMSCERYVEIESSSSGSAAADTKLLSTTLAAAKDVRGRALF